MASRKIVTESEIRLLEDADIEFISLVRHGAIQDGFRILKNDKSGDMNMSKTIYKVLAPVDVNEKKLEELKAEYEFTLEEKAEDELEGFVTYKQAEDEAVDLESKELATLDKENNIYAVVCTQVQEDEKTALKAELDYETMDKLAEGIFASMDLMLGALRIPEASKANRKNTMLNALDNLRKHIEATLKHTKAEDVLDFDSLEVKGENLEDLFYQVDTSPDAELEKEEKTEEIQKQLEDAQKQLGESLDKFKEKNEAAMDEKDKAMFDQVIEKFEEMKKELNDSLNEQFEELASKEETEKAFEDIKKELDDLKNTTKKRNSEVDEVTTKETKPATRSNRKFITFG